MSTQSYCFCENCNPLIRRRDDNRTLKSEFAKDVGVFIFLALLVLVCSLFGDKIFFAIVAYCRFLNDLPLLVKIELFL